MRPLAIVGGTGAEGLALALRFTIAGEPVLIGSRTAERGRDAAARIQAAVPGAAVSGGTNADALAACDRIVLALPFAGLTPFLAANAAALAAKLVIDVVVPLTVENGRYLPAPVPGAPSAGELIQQAAPAARVVSALKNLSAARLAELSAPLDGDVLLCGDDAGARAAVAALVARLPGVRAVDAGPLCNARAIEAITPLLLNLNRRYRAHTTIAVVGLPAGSRALTGSGPAQERRR